MSFNWFERCFMLVSSFSNIWFDRDKKKLGWIKVANEIIDWSVTFAAKQVTFYFGHCSRTICQILRPFDTHHTIHILSLNPSFFHDIRHSETYLYLSHLSKHDHRHWSGHPHIILRVLVKNQFGFLTQLHNFTLACIISYWGHFNKIFLLLVTWSGIIFKL